MSSSITIPAPHISTSAFDRRQDHKTTSSSTGSSYAGSPRSLHPTQDSPSLSPLPRHKMPQHERRPSLLSSAISKQECAFINVGDPEGPPRLISFLESSQGFVWNPEIFLPSYVECEYTPLENRRDPVHEIRLTDEEIQTMFPQ